MASDGFQFRCPGCDEDVLVNLDATRCPVFCPHCGTSFHADPDLPPDDDVSPPGALDAVRVRQLSTLRRATLRVRSWCVIGGLLSAITAVDLLGKAAVSAWDNWAWGGWETLLAAAGLATAALAGVAGRAARRLGREAAPSTLAEPTAPPDFSTLGDGAEPWRRLEEVR